MYIHTTVHIQSNIVYFDTCTWVGRRGIGRHFDIFQKIAVKFPTPAKNVRSNITEIPHPGNDLWSRAWTKIQIYLPPGQQDNSNTLPRPKATDQNLALCPTSPPPPPRRLDIDRCIKRVEKWARHFKPWCEPALFKMINQ